MASLVHQLDWPDRFVVGTVGQPGARTFYLQARAGETLVSVALEKQQAAALAERMEEVLDDLMATEGNPFSIPALAPEGLLDAEPLEEPLRELFRVGTMSLGWDASTAQVIIEAIPIIETDEPIDLLEVEPDQVVVVRIPVGAARAFARRTREVVEAGRPLCSLCGEPMDSAEHVCTLPDGFR